MAVRSAEDAARARRRNAGVRGGGGGSGGARGLRTGRGTHTQTHADPKRPGLCVWICARVRVCVYEEKIYIYICIKHTCIHTHCIYTSSRAPRERKHEREKVKRERETRRKRERERKRESESNPVNKRKGRALAAGPTPAWTRRQKCLSNSSHYSDRKRSGDFSLAIGGRG